MCVGSSMYLYHIICVELIWFKDRNVEIPTYERTHSGLSIPFTNVTQVSYPKYTSWKLNGHFYDNSSIATTCFSCNVGYFNSVAFYGSFGICVRCCRTCKLVLKKIWWHHGTPCNANCNRTLFDKLHIWYRLKDSSTMIIFLLGHTKR